MTANTYGTQAAGVLSGKPARGYRNLVVTMFVVFIFLTGILGAWYLCAKAREVERGFRVYMLCLAQGNYTFAYSCMSDTFKNKHSLQSFVESGWCRTNDVVHDVMVSSAQINMIYVRQLNPITGTAKLIVTSSTLTLPFRYEDGLIAVLANMVEENGVWKIDSEPDTMMR